MPKITFRHPYDGLADEISHQTGLDCTGDPGYTQQQFKEDSDINEIVRRFGLTGELPSDIRPPQYGDFTNITDFHTAMNAVRQAEEEFMRIPPDLRARFANDPQRLLMFVEDPNNRDEAQKLGLLKPVQQSTPPQPAATQEPKQ